MPTASPHAPAPSIGARSIIVAGLGTYRRRFWRVAVAALVVVVPLDLASSVLTGIARNAAEGAGVFSAVVSVAAAVAGMGSALLGLTFFSGVLDRLVGVDQHGHEDKPLPHTLRTLPYLRLISADVLSTAAIIVGLVLFVVPGVVLAVSWCIIGPLIVNEKIGVLHALRRSARLVWPHFWLALVIVVLPTAAEESFLAWLESFAWYHDRLALALPVDVAATLLITAVIGVVEVTLAHALMKETPL